MRKEMGYILGIIGLTTGLLGASSAHALTYQNNIGVNFTFNTSLNVSLDSANLVISELNPGTVDDSNIITVNVKTNNKLGYSLTSTVGNATYNDRNLTLKNGNKTFTSVAYGATIASNTNLTDDTWAYSYSVDNGTNWVAGSAGNTTAGYSGLPLYTDETNITTLRTSPGPTSDDGDSTKFKIAARASGTQVSGEYNNVINFNVVAEPEPMTLAMSYAAAGKSQFNGYYVMQEMTPEICANAEVVDEGSQVQLIDIRDNKLYWATKLQDGHCWMTQNLDLDLDSAVTYTHANTDLGWGTDTTTTTWTPTYSTNTVTYNSDMTGTFSTIGSGSTYYNLPSSLDVGNWYYAGYDGTTLLTSTTVNYLISANRTQDGTTVTVNNGSGVDYFSTAPFSTNGTHGHVGNYYNWSAAVASNNTSSYTASTLSNPANNPQNSICPAGWRLPTISDASNTTEGSTNEFSRINMLYNSASTSTSAGLEKSPLFLARGGYVIGASLHHSGYFTRYWSSSVDSSSNAYCLHFIATDVGPQNNYSRSVGKSVRCLAR